MKMLKKSPVYDPQVVDLQCKLNAVRNTFHHNWPLLKPDGYFGNDTERAVKGFQQSVTISSDGIVGDQTWGYLNSKVRNVPTIKSAQNNLSIGPATSNSVIEGGKNDPSILKIAGTITTTILSIVDDMDDFVKSMVKSIRNYSKVNPNALKNSYVNFTARWDPRMRELRNAVQKIIQSNETISANKPQANKRINYRHPDSIQVSNKINAQRTISSAQTQNRIYKKVAFKNSENIIKELERINLVSRIENYLKAHGISGEISLDKLKFFKGKKIKLKGGGVFLLWSLKDLIADILDFKNWGSMEWKAEFKKHLYEFVDGMIMGFAAAVIAEVIVAIVAAAATLVGITISAGWIVVIVAILAVIIAAGLMYLLDVSGKSFSETVLQHLHLAF